MIHVGDEHSWHADAPGRRLENRIVVIDRDDGERLLAVGGRRQWASDEPLPVGARVVDLVAASTEDPAMAARHWGSFLRYLHHAAGPSIFQRTLLVLGFGRIRVRIAVSDPRVRDSIVAAISTMKAFRLVSLDA